MDRVVIAQLRSHVIAVDRNLRKVRCCVDVGDGGSDRQQAIRVAGQLADELAVLIGLKLAERVLCCEDQRLVLLQLRREIARRVRQRLLRDVVVGQRGALRAAAQALSLGVRKRSGRHFEVVAEDLVVTDLQRLDARPLALGPLQVGDPLACFLCPRAVTVELAGEARTEHGRLAHDRRRLVDERAGQQVGHR